MIGCLFSMFELAIQPPGAWGQDIASAERLWAAAKSGDLEQARAALDAGVGVDSRTPYGATALIFAAEHGQQAIAELLLERGADINAKDDFYQGTPRTWAALGGHRELADFLKGKGGTASFDIGAGPAASSGEIPTIDPEQAALAVSEELWIADRQYVSDNWPQFRGLSSRGIADGQKVPVNWSVETNQNIAWKTPIPGLGHSCPVIWGDLVFVTSAVAADADTSIRIGNYGDYLSVPESAEHDYCLYALDRQSGEIRWSQVARRGVPQVKRHLKSTHANPTCCTNGECVIAFFGSEGLYCYDLTGRLLWQRDLGFLDSGWFYDSDYQWGFAASPVLVGDRVIVQCDIQKGSFIAAFRWKDGEPLWRTDRDEIPGWSTPTVCETAAGPIVVTNGSRRIRGYDARDGAELFEMAGNSEVVVPTPQFAYQTIFVTSGYKPIQPIYAISPDSRGDISLTEESTSSSAVKWALRRHGPYLPTPLVYRGFLYTLDNSGLLSCYEATTGRRVYRERIKGFGSISFVASPIAANGHIFAPAEDGQVIVIKAGPKFEVLHANPTGEPLLASPAIAQNMFFIRSKAHVIAIADPLR